MTKPWHAAFLAVTFGGALALAQSTEDLIAKARGFMDRKQYTLALETLEKVLATEPANQAALKMKEQAAKLSGEVEAAGKLDQMLAEAKTYMQQNAVGQASKKLKEILAIDPKQSEAQALLQRLDLESEMDLLAAEGQSVSVKEGDFVALDQLDGKPEIVKQIAPVYPSVAKRMGIEGEARFLVTIGTDGSVEQIQTLRRIEGWDDMNEAAAKAVKRYRFSPAQKSGVKVKTIVNLSVVFRLAQDVRAPHMR